MATALRTPRPTSVDVHPAIDELLSHLSGGPLLLESAGRPVAVLLDVERYKDMQAIYEWHQQVLQERRAS